MHILLFIILLQGQTKTQAPVDLTTPQTTSVKKSSQSPTRSPSLEKPSESTTPSLTPETALHLQMEHELGGQEEAIGNLKARVVGLEVKQENHDRPDIDDLKASRLHVLWTSSILGAVLATVVAIVLRFQKIIWGDVLRPRLRRELVEPSTAVESPKP